MTESLAMSSAASSKQKETSKPGHVFISHSSDDDSVVAAIRRALHDLGVETWTDSWKLSGGDKLKPKIRKAIGDSQHFIAVLSNNAVNSAWVKREIDYGLRIQKRRDDGFKVIPVLLPDIEPTALHLWFGEEPVAVKFDVGPAGVDKVLPRLMEALGQQLPVDPQQPLQIETAPIADLILELRDPTMIQFDGKYRAKAKAELIYKPAHGSGEVTSRR